MSSVTEPTAPASPRRVLLVASAATLAVLVVYTTTPATIAATGDALHAGVAARTWILSGMSLGLAAALLSAGTLADRAGHRRVFAWSAAALVATTAVSAAARSTGVLLAARALGGVAGAGALVAALAAIGAAYPAGPARARATGVWGASVGAGIAVGPLLAGAASLLAGWRAGYWLDAALVVPLVPAARVLGAAPSAPARRFDLSGAAAVALAMACATAAAVAARDGWARPAPLALAAVAALALAAFAVLERRVREPMLELRLLRERPFLAATTGAFFTGLAIISLMSLVPAVLVVSGRATTLGSAAVLAIWSVTSALFALAARRLPARFDSGRRLVAGLVLVAAGEALVAAAGGGATWPALAPGLFVAGVGSGLANAALGHLAVASVPAGRGGLGAGVNNTARYFGASAGVALFVALAGGHGPDALVRGWGAASAAMAGLCLLGAALVAVCVEPRLTRARSAAPRRSADARTRTPVAVPAAAEPADPS